MRVRTFALLGTAALVLVTTPAYPQNSAPESAGSAPSLAQSLPADGPSRKDGKPKKIKEPKIKEIIPRKMRASIEDGTLTVDGMIAKARLNYTIHDSYLYFYVPDIGTIVVAQAAFPGAVLQQKAFQNNTLTIEASGHQIQLTSDVNFATKKGDAYVLIDQNFRTDALFPMMGYGHTRNAPYIWPGSRRPASPLQTSAIKVPPVPPNLLPRMETEGASAVTASPQSK